MRGMCGMQWTKQQIVAKLTALAERGRDLSYAGMSRRQQKLVSAAAYHFGSYRKALADAGVDYAQVARRPRWTKQRVIAVIKAAKRRGEDLHWSAVVSGENQLSRAAYAALQPRLFGSWARAMQAAGLDEDDVRLYRVWNKTLVVTELRMRRHGEVSLASGAVQSEDPGLHAAAVRHFGSYEAALVAAHVNPERVRLRRRWSKELVKAELAKRAKRGLSLSDTAVRKSDAALYGAALRLFGKYTAARGAGGRFNR